MDSHAPASGEGRGVVDTCWPGPCGRRSLELRSIQLEHPTSTVGQAAESRPIIGIGTERDGRVTLPCALNLRRSPMRVEPKYHRQARLPVRGRRPPPSLGAPVEETPRELRGRLIYTSAARGRLSSVSGTFKFSSPNDALAVCSQIQLRRAPRGRFAR